MRGSTLVKSTFVSLYETIIGYIGYIQRYICRRFSLSAMFKRLLSAKDARDILSNLIEPVKDTEFCSLEASSGRVLSSDVISSADLPGFPRAAMDGFAVTSEETRRARPSAPVYLHHFLAVRTGMAVPAEFDAVVMLEDSAQRSDLLEVRAEMHHGRNISAAGEDIRRGDVVYSEGHRLRPPDLALLAALGNESAAVFRRPEVAIIPTGGELISCGARGLRPGEAYEVNGLMAQLYVRMWGGLPLWHDIVPDDKMQIRQAVESGLHADMVILIGGTSVGEKDYAPQVLNELGELLVHGVRIQPGKPTSFGRAEGKPVICLPGYPVAALSALYLFVRPAVKMMAHLPEEQPKKLARLSRKIASKAGYESIVRVALTGGKAEPIMATGAGILSSVARAEGYVVVPEELEGLEAGEEVEVNLFE
jgi:molybdopterin molybdotransferase